MNTDKPKYHFPMAPAEHDPHGGNGEEFTVCCGPPPAPPAGPHEIPGYRILDFVKSFLKENSKTVPVVKTRLDLQDYAGAFLVRCGMGRGDYKIAPGLYAVGSPDKNSMVLATGNYKLSFDHVRKHLSGLDLWILVLDTRGINVWCAAGKGTFGSRELALRIKLSGLEKIVHHRNIIVPQLGATGVSAGKVKKLSGFRVIWGPVRSSDLPCFLEQKCRSTKDMRMVTFGFKERAVLVPVEISLIVKQLFWLLPVLFIVSGIGPDVFSFSKAWTRGMDITSTLISAMFAGTVLTPLFLPTIPGRFFSSKGALTSMACIIFSLLFFPGTGVSDTLARMLLGTSAGSFLAMNFTGATPFTSPSGVEFEMKKSIPWQLAGAVSGTILWLLPGFLN